MLAPPNPFIHTCPVLFSIFQVASRPRKGYLKYNFHFNSRIFMKKLLPSSLPSPPCPPRSMPHRPTMPRALARWSGALPIWKHALPCWSAINLRATAMCAKSSLSTVQVAIRPMCAALPRSAKPMKPPATTKAWPAPKSAVPARLNKTQFSARIPILNAAVMIDSDKCGHR